MALNYVKAMLNLIYFYKGIFLHLIPVHIIGPCWFSGVINVKKGFARLAINKKQKYFSSLDYHLAENMILVFGS